MNENVIEWLKGQQTVALTLTAGSKFAKKIVKYSETHDDVDYKINKDGSVFAHVPLKWIKISPPRIMSEQQKTENAKRLQEYRSRSVMRREKIQKEEK